MNCRFDRSGCRFVEGPKLAWRSFHDRNVPNNSRLSIIIKPKWRLEDKNEGRNLPYRRSISVSKQKNPKTRKKFGQTSRGFLPRALSATRTFPRLELVILTRIRHQGSRRPTFSALCMVFMIATWFKPVRFKLVLTWRYIEKEDLCSVRACGPTPPPPIWLARLWCCPSTENKRSRLTFRVQIYLGHLNPVLFRISSTPSMIYIWQRRPGVAHSEDSSVRRLIKQFGDV